MLLWVPAFLASTLGLRLLPDAGEESSGPRHPGLGGEGWDWPLSPVPSCPADTDHCLSLRRETAGTPDGSRNQTARATWRVRLGPGTLRERRGPAATYLSTSAQDPRPSGRLSFRSPGRKVLHPDTGTTLTRGASDGSGRAPAPDAASITPRTPRILDLVRRHVPGAQLVEELPHELVLALPYAGALDGSFAMVFQELDRQLEALGLTGYGISDTNLEEVWDLVGF